MRNYVQPGESLDLTAPSGGTVAGTMYKIGSILCVAAASVAAGLKFAAYVLGVFDLPKATGAVTEGQLLYWDDTAKNITTTATSNTKAGVAAQAAASGDATVRIRLVPTI